MSVNQIDRPVFSDTAVGLRSSIRAALRQPLADYYLVIVAVVLLSGIGLYEMISASSVLAMVQGHSPYYYGLHQGIMIAAGAIGALVLSRLSRRALVIVSWLGVALAIVLLAFVVVPGGFGFSSGGNQAWLSIGPVQFQPSEFAKVALVLWAAALFTQPDRINNLGSAKALFLPYLPVAGLILGLVAAEKDLGTAVIVGIIVIAPLWLVGAPGKLLGGAALVGAVGAGLMVVFDSVRRAKVLSFIGTMLPFLHLAPPASDQPQNAIYALATGGWWGVGPGASRQKWGGLYNGAHTDYILAVLGEELGLFGILIVLGLMVTIVVTGLRIARRNDALFWRIAAGGVATWIFVQAGLNTLVAFGMFPVMGVPFPFVSYGGSAIMSALFGVGILLAAALHEPLAVREMADRRARKGTHRTTEVIVARRAPR
ncbi:MAG: putative lipid II flippase FtsW [Propionibacteriaceae bacterium]|nr:putative lipid II flippase FtsW [Propionibacteriaceae bacterium]